MGEEEQPSNQDVQALENVPECPQKEGPDNPIVLFDSVTCSLTTMKLIPDKSTVVSEMPPAGPQLPRITGAMLLLQRKGAVKLGWCA